MTTIPNRSVFYLTIAASLLLATYVVLMVSTIVFASLQTKLAQNVQEAQMDITKLEASYYAAIGLFEAMDPYALGYVAPEDVAYVQAAQPAAVSFAD